VSSATARARSWSGRSPYLRIGRIIDEAKVAKGAKAAKAETARF